MNTWAFFVSLLAINIVIHLLRLPHLILDNGDGAFLILYMLVLHIVALPMILVEIALIRNREKMSLKETLALKKASGSSTISQSIAKTMSLLQVLMLFFLSCFFVYMIGFSLTYIIQYAAQSLSSSLFLWGGDEYPSMSYSLLGTSLVVLMGYKVGKRGGRVCKDSLSMGSSFLYSCFYGGIC